MDQRIHNARAGDRVYNSRSERWGLVVRVELDAVTGAAIRVRVKPSLAPRTGWAWEATWWLASSITEVVVASREPEGR